MMKKFLILSLLMASLPFSLEAIEAYNQFKDKDIEFSVEEAKAPKIYFPDPVGDKKRAKKKRQMEKDFAIKMSKKWRTVWKKALASHELKYPSHETKLRSITPIPLDRILDPKLYQQAQVVQANQRSQVAKLNTITDHQRLNKLKNLFAMLKLKKLPQNRLVKALNRHKKPAFEVGRKPAQINRSPSTLNLKNKWQKFICLNGFDKLFKSTKCR